MSRAEKVWNQKGPHAFWGFGTNTGDLRHNPAAPPRKCSACGGAVWERGTGVAFCEFPSAYCKRQKEILMRVRGPLPWYERGPNGVGWRFRRTAEEMDQARREIAEEEALAYYKRLRATGASHTEATKWASIQW